jgi:murein DD-endopeptidase MepM/ murein hydrolase activator NlpD
MQIGKRTWWRDRFVTLMVIPERTRRVHKLVLPFFLFKLGVIMVSLSAVFLVLIGVDYIHVLGRLSENKRLKGENFKLRQDLQLIRNKVESMETTVDRVRNYAKKLQVLTGQGEKGAGGRDLSSPEDSKIKRGPAATDNRRSMVVPVDPDVVLSGLGDGDATLVDRMHTLGTVSADTEYSLAQLQVYFLAQSAVIAATPSLLPINGWLSSAYGYRRHPIDGSYRLHAGVDIVADPGTPVRAPADGHVLFAGDKQGYGKVVVVDHGYGIRTLHAHVSRFFVNSGMRVKRGDKIAEVGATGKATAPHLHYEIRKNGMPVNPTTFFSAVRF